MKTRMFCLLLLLAMPAQAHAAQYTVQPGDSLGIIAQRFHVSVVSLESANGIANPNLIQVGRVLLIPEARQTFRYRVRWGDTLSGLALRYHLTVGLIRSMNPSLGAFPLAGQWLSLCSPCTSGSYGVATEESAPAGGNFYVVRPGDTLSGIAARFGVSPEAVTSVNHVPDPNQIVIGSRLSIPSSAGGVVNDPWGARALIENYAARYGVESSLALAVAWQESGFNQTLVSSTGAIGVMQVEPYTASHIGALWGRSVNPYNMDDNVHAGVYWLGVLLQYYGGDERLAVAAYYQGTHSIARYGLFSDTVQYVNDVMSLKASFGG